MKPRKPRLCRSIDFRNTPFSRIAVTCLAAFTIQFSSPAYAAPITWADSTGNTTWATGASWVAGTAPANSTTTDNAIFTSVSNAQPNLTAQSRIRGVDFQMANGGLAMTGNNNLFQPGVDGISSSGQISGTNTITNSRIFLVGSYTWNLFSTADSATTSTFTFDSNIRTNGTTLTIVGQRDSAAGNVGIINFDRAIQETGGITVSSLSANNTVNFNAANTHTGLTTVIAGIVNVSGDQSAANGGWNIQTANDGAAPVATVNFNAGSTIAVAGANSIQIGAAANSGGYPASTLNVAGTVTNDGTLQMERNSNLNLNSGASWAQGGNLTVTGRGGADAMLNVNAGAEMTYSGASTVKLNRAANSGGVGRLTIDSTGVFTTGAGFENIVSSAGGSGNGRITLTNGGTLTLSADVANLTTQVNFNLGTGGGVVDNNGFNVALGGAVTGDFGTNYTGITGSGGLTSTGGGTLTLTGENTYTGTTTVSAGTLLVNGSISTSSLTTVASGATVGGSGTIGDLTVSTGALINPGNSTGILNTGNYTQGGLYTSEINGLTVGSLYDQINVAGSVDITGGSLSTLFTGSYSLNDMLFLLLNDESDAITGTFTGFSQGATVASYGGFDWRISYNADSGTNSFTGGNDIALMAIPEPSVALLCGLGISLALLRRRLA